jgi:hypothetical protein
MADGAMWFRWKHTCEPVFRAILALGGDLSRHQYWPGRRDKHEQLLTSIPLLDMLVAKWALLSIAHLPPKYSQLHTLPVSWSGTVTSRNMVAAQAWQQREPEEAEEATHIPADLVHGAQRHMTSPCNRHLLHGEHEALLLWLVSKSDAAGQVEESILRCKQALERRNHAARQQKRPQTGCDAETVFEKLLDRLRRSKLLPPGKAATTTSDSGDTLSTARGATQLSSPSGEAAVVLGYTPTPGDSQAPVALVGEGSAQTAFLLNRLVRLGAVPSASVLRTLLFYRSLLPASVQGLVWFRRRHMVVMRQITRARSRGLAMQQQQQQQQQQQG